MNRQRMSIALYRPTSSQRVKKNKINFLGGLTLFLGALLLSGGAGGGEGVLFLRAPSVKQIFGAPNP